MKHSYKSGAIILYFFWMMLSASVCSARQYTLGLVEWEPWGTAYVAEQNGFFKSEGINVKVIQFPEYKNGSVKAFKYGKTDFSIMMIGSAADMIEKRPRYIIIHEHCWSHGGDLFILSSKFSDISQIKNRKIGMYTTQVPVLFFLNKVLEQKFLSFADFDLVEVSNTIQLNQAFREGIFSAIISYDTDASIVIKDGTGKLSNTSADFPGVIPEGIVVQKDIFTEFPNDVARFLRAWFRSIKWQNDPENTQVYFKLLNKTMFKKNPRTDQEFIEIMASGKLHRTLDDIKYADTKGIQTYLKELLSFMKDQGMIVRTDNPDDYFSGEMAIQEAGKIFK